MEDYSDNQLLKEVPGSDQAFGTNSIRLSFAFSQVSRYLRSLQLIVGRYQEVSRKFVDSTNRVMAMSQRKRNGDSFSEESAVFDEGRPLNDQLHLEIESFYLFAKIFLDKIAHFLEFYFGSVRGKSLDSHDQLVKNFEAFCDSNGLDLPADFMTLAGELKTAISDHRDYQIAHGKNPRTAYGTMYGPEGRTRISMVRLAPTDRDKQIETMPLDDLLTQGDRYLRMAIEIVKSNRNRSRLLSKNL
jgi:hypothetical protein